MFNNLDDAYAGGIEALPEVRGVRDAYFATLARVALTLLGSPGDRGLGVALDAATLRSKPGSMRDSRHMPKRQEQAGTGCGSLAAGASHLRVPGGGLGAASPAGPGDDPMVVDYESGRWL